MNIEGKFIRLGNLVEYTSAIRIIYSLKISKAYETLGSKK